jgi:outer membrane lipoprotein carrier protein
MNRIIILILSVLLSLQIWSQTKLNRQQQQVVMQQIDKAAAKMMTMECDFTQSKRMKMLKRIMVSKGVMYFKRDDKLRWQYTTPYDYIFILNGDKVSLKSAKSTKNIDVKNNKIFKQITSIILDCITGVRLNGSTQFNIELYKEGQTYFATMYPKKKEVKQVYNTISVYFNPALTLINKVVMEEKTGDVTTIVLSNIKNNVEIQDKVFEIR